MTRPLIIDSFAGGGGASTGIEMALGRSPDVAINHNAEALALHEANHPDTKHLVTSVYAVDPRDVVKSGQTVGLAWFSPDCKHFSKAKGGAPLSKNIRDLAWVVVHWAELVRPKVIALENVEEFQTWAPLRHKHEGGCRTTAAMTADLWDKAPPEVKGTPVFNKDGTPFMEPDPRRKGETFRKWVARLRRLGYRVEWRELRGCDYGSPTIRKRLFVIARCDGQPIVWPEPTHGDPNSDAVKSGKLKPWRTAAECIDWSIPCPSIFDIREEIKDRYGVSAKRPLVPNTLARIARGMHRYVLEADEPFIVDLNCGGANAAASPYVTRFNGGATGQPVTEPLGTVTANSFIKRPGGAAPLGTVTPFLASIAHGDSGERPGQHPRALDIGAPLGTVVAGGIKHALAAPVLTYAQHGGACRSVTDPHHTICANYKDQNSVIVPAIVGCGGRAGQSRPRSGLEPMATITAKADSCLTGAFLAQHNSARIGVHPGRALDAPISTITASGSHQMLTASYFAKYYGTGDGAETGEPMHTITVRDRIAHMQASLHPPVFGPEHQARARQVADFLREHGYWDDREFVTLTIDGETFVVVDIGMRMLTPRELFTAQGFPTDYVIEGVWIQDGDEWTWKPFTKSVQVSCCGNSVCPQVAAAIIGANCAELAMKEAA
ncbi:MAG: hypothetical protein CSA72_10420 [Rhodobacterales bacterium]|nr:MAG: hypothetical protein CSA72_10420 [Rhodobacterales bacterium]